MKYRSRYERGPRKNNLIEAVKPRAKWKQTGSNIHFSTQSQGIHSTPDVLMCRSFLV